MKKLMILIFMLIITTAYLVGCTKTEEVYYQFKGESENWAAVFEVNVTYQIVKIDNENVYEGTKSKALTLTYKGDLSELSNAAQLRYSYKTSAGGGSEEMTFESPPKEKTFIHKSFSSNGLSNYEKEDESISVIVELDGVTETVEMTRSKD